jgi:hypothetical protein
VFEVPIGQTMVAGVRGHLQRLQVWHMLHLLHIPCKTSVRQEPDRDQCNVYGMGHRMHRKGEGLLRDRLRHKWGRVGPPLPRIRPRSMHLDRTLPLVSCPRLGIRIRRCLAKDNQHSEFCVCLCNCPSRGGRLVVGDLIQP